MNLAPVFLILTILWAAVPSQSRKKLVVLTSGETHATLDACDCSDAPGGGFAKRATLVARMRDTGDVVLVDAGGFSGGGVYDSYTQGRAKDSMRTAAALRAMGYMKYDAACIGDDDLQCGGKWLAAQASAAHVPLVSANCFGADGNPLGATYVLIHRGGHVFGVTGVTTQERIISTDESVRIDPAVPSLRKIWPELTAKSEFRIILAHIGEDESRRLLDSFPECALVVNGHRKSSTGEFINDRGQVMLQFGFQGKALSFAEIRPDGKGIGIAKNGWLDVKPDIPDEPVVAQLVTLPETGNNAGSKTVFDLYIMAQCPYGCAALREFTSFVARFPQAEWNVWFIGSTAIDGSLSSLHGADEVADEQLWLAVHALYPDRWLEFLTKRSAATETKTEAVARSMRLDMRRLREWALKKGGEELAGQYTRSMRMDINASPTLLVNNIAFRDEITTARLAGMLCGFAGMTSAYCDSVPECFADRDCKRPGKNGACVSRGGKAVCVYSDAVRFTVAALVPDTAISHPEIAVIASLDVEFPGMAVDTVRLGSAHGKELAAAYDPPFLPLFLMDTAIAKAQNFHELEPSLVRVRDKFTFAPGMVKPCFFYKRTVSPRAATLYVDPVFPGAKDAVRIFIEAGKKSRKISILPLVYDSAAASAEESMRNEEALRWLVLADRYPAAYPKYLERFAERAATSYWFTDCKQLGINVDEFVALVQKNAPRFSAHRKEIGELGIRGPVEILVDNREVVAIKNQKELADLLGMVLR
jgi:hypothetical protein